MPCSRSTSTTFRKMTKRKIKVLSQKESDATRMSDEEYEKYVDEMSAQIDAANAAEIRSWRKRHGWTQKQLANELDISQPHLSNWERGVWSPPMYLFLALDAIEFRDVIEKAKAKKR